MVLVARLLLFVSHHFFNPTNGIPNFRMRMCVASVVIHPFVYVFRCEIFYARTNLRNINATMTDNDDQQQTMTAVRRLLNRI